MLLDVKDLRVTFRVDGGKVLRAVDGVSFGVAQGESVGLVGESGCGKTTIGNALVGLTPVAAGSILFNGVEVTRLRGAALRNYRQQVQMVFQDPFGSLNPRMTIGNAIAEVLEVHKLSKTRDQRHERVAQLLRDVGLAPEYARRYPHEFSGGQRQRVGIARALALQPSLIVADEPVSALDVSIQAQILKLLQGLRENLGFSCLFIAHDLAVVRYICDRALVMYLGKIVESAPCDELFAHPAHPYTEALLSAAPDVDKGLAARKSGGTRIVLQGDIPSATELIPGCPFHPRCHRARERCRTIVPERKVVGPGHESVCHFAEQLL